MNTYVKKAKEETESKIVALIHDFELINGMEVSAINFTRQSMCDKQEQKIKTWGISLNCTSS